MGRQVQFGIRALLITTMFCAAIGAVYSFQIREAAKEKHELARVVAFDEFTDHCLAVNDRIKPKLKQFLNEEEHFPKPSKGHIAGGVTVTSFEFSSSEESSGRLRIEYNWQDSSQPRNQPTLKIDISTRMSNSRACKISSVVTHGEQPWDEMIADFVANELVKHKNVEVSIEGNSDLFSPRKMQKSIPASKIRSWGRDCMGM